MHPHPVLSQFTFADVTLTTSSRTKSLGPGPRGTVLAVPLTSLKECSSPDLDWWPLLLLSSPVQGCVAVCIPVSAASLALPSLHACSPPTSLSWLSSSSFSFFSSTGDNLSNWEVEEDEDEDDDDDEDEDEDEDEEVGVEVEVERVRGLDLLTASGCIKRITSFFVKDRAGILDPIPKPSD